MNILDIKEFYKTPLGTLMHASITNLMSEFDVEMNFEDIEIDQSDIVRVGYGYPIPYCDDKNPIPVLMPYQMGATQWPVCGNDEETISHTVMIDEETLPLCDQSVNQLIMVHGFEHALNADIVLAECYRVLKRDGSLVIITPNRRSLWAHSDYTPLGHGRPYTMTQLRKKLEGSHFYIHSCKRSLYTPAYNNDWCISLSGLFEKICPLFARKFSGLIAIHATKSTPATQGVFSPLAQISLNKRQYQLNISNRRLLIDAMT